MLKKEKNSCHLSSLGYFKSDNNAEKAFNS